MPAIQSFKVDALTVRIYASQADMAADSADEARRHLKAVLSEAPGKPVSAVLATGNSQLNFIEACVALKDFPWSKMNCFHMDEYLGISADHSASFRRYMRERVERRVAPLAFNYVEGDAMEPLAECERYEALLKAQPIALCCLGIGENGHLAFNDPPVANFDDPRWVKIVKLDIPCRMQQVGEGHFPNVDAVPQYALTLTIPALCAAGKMLCIVPEKRKAQAVKAALTGPIGTQCPGSYLRRQPQALLLLDNESASLL